MRTSDEDLTLLAGIAEGDPTCESAFVSRFKTRFELIARFSGVPDQDCEDVAQEALIAAFSQIRRKLFRGDSSLGTWLEAILHGKIVDYQRRCYRHGLPDVTISTGDPDVSRESTALVVRQQSEVRILVREVLLQLPRQHRIILVLNMLIGLTIEEIAGRFGLPTGTVGRILSEAKRQFREILMKSPEEFSTLRRLKEAGDE